MDDHKADEVLRKRVVFADWEKRGTPHPVTYTSLNRSLLEHMRKGDCCFARKFPYGSIHSAVWLNFVMETDQLHKCDNDHEEPLTKRQRCTEEEHRSTD